MKNGVGFRNLSPKDVQAVSLSEHINLSGDPTRSSDMTDVEKYTGIWRERMQKLTMIEASELARTWGPNPLVAHLSTEPGVVEPPRSGVPNMAY